MTKPSIDDFIDVENQLIFERHVAFAFGDWNIFENDPRLKALRDAYITRFSELADLFEETAAKLMDEFAKAAGIFDTTTTTEVKLDDRTGKEEAMTITRELFDFVPPKKLH